MHYYKRNIGDYAKKCGRLSMLQHGAYTLLIDACYDREQFPTLEQALEWTWASTEAEIEAVKFVLARFFTLDADGQYVQHRILAELLDYHEKSNINKRIAEQRETNRRMKSTNRAPVVDEAPPNQEPITNNHKTRTKNQEPKIEPSGSTPLPPGLDTEAWSRWIDYRKRIGKPLKPISIPAAQKALAGHGANQSGVVEQSIVNGWQGLFELKQNGRAGQPNKQEALEARNRAIGEEWLREQEALDARH